MKNTSHGLINMAKKCVKYQGHTGIIFKSDTLSYPNTYTYKI